VAKELKAKEGSSTIVIAFSAILALGAAGVVYYFYEEARKSEDALARAKGEYKKMAEWKRPVEEYLRQQKGRPATQVESSEDLMTFLDKKSRESQIPPGMFSPSKNAGAPLAAWTETSYTVSLQSTKETPIKKAPVVDFLRKVETERRTAKVKSLQLAFNGDDLKSATLTISQFTPK